MVSVGIMDRTRVRITIRIKERVWGLFYHHLFYVVSKVNPQIHLITLTSVLSN